MNVQFSQRIGVSTLALRKMPLDEAIAAVYENGFKVFELVPHLYGGPESFDLNTRKNLRERLAGFEIATVHSSGAKLTDGRGVDIASSEDLHRRQSVEHYLAHIQLALDLEAKLVTLHPGVGDDRSTSDTVREANLVFAEAALEKIKDSDLQIGYEYFDGELTTEIGNPKFGILFDVGHAALRFEGDPNPNILRSLEELFPHIVQFHIHGVRASPQGEKEDHNSLQVNNGIDYAKVIEAIKRYGFGGPLLFEIGIREEGQNISENLKDAVYAREELVKMWESV